MPNYVKKVERTIQREVDKDLYFIRNINQGGRYEVWHSPSRTKPYHVVNLTTREGKLLIPGDNMSIDYLKNLLMKADLSNSEVRKRFNGVVDHNIHRQEQLEIEGNNMIHDHVMDNMDMLMEKPRQFVPDNLEKEV